MTLRPAMSFLRLTALLVAATSACLTAHATPTGPTASIEAQNSSAFTGTLFEQVSPTLAFFGGFSYQIGNQTYSFDGNDLIGFGNVPSPADYSYLGFLNGDGDMLFLAFQAAPYFVNGSHMDYHLCTTTNNCTDGSSQIVAYVTPHLGDPTNFTEGSLHLTLPNVAATPEPSSIALLGTGVLGVFGAARRRFLRS